MRFLWLISFILFFSSFPAHSTITITQVTGASSFDSDSSIIRGGIAGDARNCPSGTKNGTDTCNSCTSTTPCNERSIYNDLELRIYFKTDDSSKASGTIVGVNDTNTNVTSSSSSSSGSIAADTELFIGFKWSEICNTVGGIGSDCEIDTAGTSAGFAKTLKIGFDTSGDKTLGTDEEAKSITIQLIPSPDITSSLQSNHTDCYTTSAAETNEGVCGVILFPGDEKVFIDDLDNDSGQAPIFVSAGFPSTGRQGVNFSIIRFYYGATNSPSQITVNSDSVDIEVNADLELDSDCSCIKNLINDQTYTFKVASVDQAQNVIGLTSDTTVSANLSYYQIAPSEVFGILDDSTQCFIATATYGSKEAHQVVGFRNFRDQFLIHSGFGRKFVELYYRASPRVAQLISESEVLKQISRLFLTPIWWVAELSNRIQFNLFLFLLPFAILIPLMVIIFRLIRRRGTLF